MKRYLAWFFVLIWSLLIWQLTTTPDFKITQDSFLSLVISNGGHFFFFGIQAVLLYLAYPSYLFALTSSSLYGFVIEYFQRSIPGRSGDPLDWLLDTLGAVIFLYLFKKLSSRT